MNAMTPITRTKKPETIAVLNITGSLYLPSSIAPTPGIERSDLDAFLTGVIGHPIAVDQINSFVLRSLKKGDDQVIESFDDIVFDAEGQEAKDRKVNIALKTTEPATVHVLTLIEGNHRRIVGSFESLETAVQIGNAWMERKLEL